MNTHIKVAGSSSDGTVVFITSDKQVFAVNVDMSRLIKGVDGYLSCYLNNTLRVFTPAVVDVYKETTHIKLTLEDVEFISKTVEVPEWIADGVKQ